MCRKGCWTVLVVTKTDKEGLICPGQTGQQHRQQQQRQANTDMPPDLI